MKLATLHLISPSANSLTMLTSGLLCWAVQVCSEATGPVKAASANSAAAAGWQLVLMPCPLLVCAHRLRILRWCWCLALGGPNL